MKRVGRFCYVNRRFFNPLSESLVCSDSLLYFLFFLSFRHDRLPESELVRAELSASQRVPSENILPVPTLMVHKGCVRLSTHKMSVSIKPGCYCWFEKTQPASIQGECDFFFFFQKLAVVPAAPRDGTLPASPKLL